MRCRFFSGPATGRLPAVLAILALLATVSCITRLSSGPRHMADGRRLNPFAYVGTQDNVSVVVGTKLARHSISDKVFPLQILVRNNSAEVIHIDAANFLVRDSLGQEYPPVRPEFLKDVYSRVNFDYELARTTEFVGLLNSGMSGDDNLDVNFYSHSTERIVIDRLDMRPSTRIVDILYYEIPRWQQLDGPLTMVVRNLRDRPPLEVTFALPSR